MKIIEEDIKYCDVFTTEVFAEQVKCGSFISYDGIGYYHDGEDETDIEVDFNYDLVMEKVAEYPYVCWYNK